MRVDFLHEITKEILEQANRPKATSPSWLSEPPAALEKN